MASINFPNFIGPVDGLFSDFLNNFKTQWGIYNSKGEPLTGFGLSIIGAIQSTESFTYDKRSVISNFPVQQGNFATYNKVKLPATPAVILNLTGTTSDRTQFLNTIDSAIQSNELLTIITPEIRYINYSVQSYNYSRTASKGANLLSVTLFLMEVIEISLSVASNTTIQNPSNPSDTALSNGGKVQASSADTQTTNAVQQNIG